MNTYTFKHAVYKLVHPISLVTLIALLAFGTVSLMPKPSRLYNYGIVRLCQAGTKIYAYTFFPHVVEYYLSEDGGLTWHIQNASVIEQIPCLDGQILQAEQSSVPVNQNSYVTDGVRLYRYSAGESIESSPNGGLTWTQEVNLSGINHEARGALQRQMYAPTTLIANPLDALVDRQTRNVIMAMGSDGVLVRIANGTWQNVDVGIYGYYKFTRNYSGRDER